MTTKKTRQIVQIDEDKCDGCGLCVPSCAEGAIQIIDGKAKLIADNLCDGIGNCLGTCPRDAIKIIEREADEFDEAAVNAAANAQSPAPFSCPGAMVRNLAATAPKACPSAAPAASAANLPHWPVQLSLVPATGAMWDGADVLISADCVAHAMGNFHQALLTGEKNALAIACPKLDDVQLYITKLAEIFSTNNIRSLTVAHMEVPCCNGIVTAVRRAIEAAGKQDIPFRDVTVGIDGSILKEQ